MIIIGEKINSSIPSARDLISGKDTEKILGLAKKQSDAGADFIDINAGMFPEKEAELCAYMAEIIVRELSLPLSVDTPDYRAAEAAIQSAAAAGEKSGWKLKHLINSVTVEPQRLEHMTSLAKEYGCGVVALCMQEDQMPESLESRLAIAGKLTDYLTRSGISPDDIYIDPMLHPLGADENSGLDALETIRRIRSEYPECHISCGLSNLSYGLPKRKLLNRAFAVAAVIAGLDAAILDPLDQELMGLIAASEAISGKDEYCLEYISKCREGLI